MSWPFHLSPNFRAGKAIAEAMTAAAKTAGVSDKTRMAQPSLVGAHVAAKQEGL